MKHSLSIFLFSTLLLFGCSPSSSTSSDIGTLPVESSSSPSSVSTYDDEIISCQYDASLLSPGVYDDVPEFSYNWLITSSELSEDDKHDAVLNGSCIYVVSPNSNDGHDWGSAYESVPFTLTQAYFDGVFRRNPKSTFSITVSNDSCYEYSLSQSGYTFKGKFLSVSPDSMTSVVYRVSDDLPPDLIDAFEDCYESIVYTKTDSLQPSAYDEFLEELDREAEEKAAQAVQITEGDLYDSITSIYSNVNIYDMSDTLGIYIFIPHETYSDDTTFFFSILSSICLNCDIEDYYSGIVFTMFVGDSYITNMVLTNYTSPESFSSAEPITSKEEYKEYISSYYSTYFSSHDIGATFERNLDSFEEKYGLD